MKTNHPISPGTYCLASKYTDGDPQDAWAVGFYDHEERGRHFLIDSNGDTLRANGFRRVGAISSECGKWLLDHAQDIEGSDYSVWYHALRRMVEVRSWCGPEMRQTSGHDTGQTGD